jgi:hypothetical protein
VGQKTTTNFSAQVFWSKQSRLDLDECLDGPPYVLGKLGESDGIPLTRFVTDLNLTPELLITRPLKGCNGFSIWKVDYSTENVTDADADMCCCLGTKWCGKLRIYQSVAVASNSCFERKAKCPVRVQEKDRHLQCRLCDVVSSVGNGMRGPQSLRHHTSSTHDPTVEHPSGLVGKLRVDMLGHVSNDEGIAFSPTVVRGGDGVALQ